MRVQGLAAALPGADYVKIGRAVWFLPLGRLEAEARYRCAMQKLSYKPNGSGLSGNRPGPVTWMLHFVPRGHDADALTVSLNFHPEHGGTAVQYYATVIVPRPGPPG